MRAAARHPVTFFVALSDERLVQQTGRDSAKDGSLIWTESLKERHRMDCTKVSRRAAVTTRQTPFGENYWLADRRVTLHEAAS